MIFQKMAECAAHSSLLCHVDFSSESEFTGALRATNAALVVVGLEDVEMRTETGPPSTRTR